jgi:LPS O-antigen subunit length determinant protein (WzzB/FepE family)
MWLVNTHQKPEYSSTRMQMYPLFCHPYLIMLISIVAILFALGLAVTAPQDWNLGQILIQAFCYLLIVGSITAIWCCL